MYVYVRCPQVSALLVNAVNFSGTIKQSVISTVTKLFGCVLRKQLMRNDSSIEMDPTG